MEDIHLLIRDKYDGDASRVTEDDLARIASGEPLAYVIGWVPFLGLRIGLSTKPLIPRPETEWWTELLVRRIGNASVTVLDLCAGSGAIGLAILKHCPNAIVAFGEINPEHAVLIEENIENNGLDISRTVISSGDLFGAFPGISFNIVATNPPYVPSERELDASVTRYEPAQALYGGADGLSLIRRIAKNAAHHVNGELWLECDTSHAHAAATLLEAGGAKAVDIRTDLYGRERLVLAYY